MVGQSQDAVAPDYKNHSGENIHFPARRASPGLRPDELIRGADIVGTPLASFAKILATSDRQSVFNGYCGAESGDVPVSAVSPAILVSEIEVQRKKVSEDAAPYLSRPPVAGGSAQ